MEKLTDRFDEIIKCSFCNTNWDQETITTHLQAEHWDEIRQRAKETL